MRSWEEVIKTRTSSKSAVYRFSQDEMDIVKRTDLPDLLSHLGYQVRRLGSFYTTKEMDSIHIKNRRSWRRYSTGQGGDAITFLQEFCDKSFPEAVNYLLEFNGHRARDSPSRPLPRTEQPPEKSPFVLPTPNWDQRRVFAYLQKRGIAPQVIRDFIQAGLLYEDALHHNCVFVGKDGGGQPRFASKRGTYDLGGPGFKGDVTGSDKNVAFPLPCAPDLDWVAVFEAPIDLMSFCTLHPKVKSNAVALCGLYQGALDTYLKDHPHLRRIVLCLDADGPGQEATQKLKEAYEQKGFQVSTRTPSLGKDWNEYLQHLVFGKEITAPKITNSEPKKEVNQPMADLGKLVTEKAAADALWKEQRKAEREAAASLRDESVTEITSAPEVFARYLDMQGDNPAYGAGNIALVMKQNPEAAVFFTRDHWKAKGRFVLEDQQEKGAKIFARSSSGRSYVLADAFDVTQTQGRDVRMPHLENDTPQMEIALTALLNYSPVRVEANAELSTGAYYAPRNMVLSINPGYSDSQAFAAIATEIAQARFHDRGYNPNYSREGCELSAQSVSYILCRRFGISQEWPSLSRLPSLCKGWPAQDRLEFLNTIQGMSRQIGNSIEKSLSPPQRATPPCTGRPDKSILHKCGRLKEHSNHMKKTVSLLFTALILCATLLLPASAAEGSCYYPISVEEYTYGPLDELRIDKTYQLSLDDDSSGIPTKDFVRGGRLYYLLDMTKKDEVGVDTQTYTQTVTLPSDTNNMEDILQKLDAEIEVTTEEGYTGTLHLDHTTVQVTTDGYATKTGTVSATRSYPNLSEADLTLIPKSIEDKGRTLTLADVQWSNSTQTDGEGNPIIRYTASAKYTGTTSSKYATGYTVSADYTGEVAKTDCNVITYTATFGSMEAPEDLTNVSTPDSSDPNGDKSLNLPSVNLSAVKRPLMIGGLTAVLIAGSVFVFKKVRERR